MTAKRKRPKRRVMTARMLGYCAVCHERIVPGDEIVYDYVEMAAAHESCFYGRPPPVPVGEEES